MKYKLLIFMIGFAVHSAFGQTTYRYQSSNGFQFIELVRGYDNGKIPLLIAFHYSGGTPEETMLDYTTIKGPIRIIIPKGNYKKRAGFSYYPVDYYKQDSITQFSQSKITTDSLAVFVNAMVKKFKTKAIVSGISQGGDISFQLACYYPHLCRASFPFAEVIQPYLIKELKSISRKNRIPIYLFQGQNDEIVSWEITKEKIRKIGNSLTIQFFSYPNVGHELSTEMKHDFSKIINTMDVH